MENKNFMALTEDELYDVNGGRGAIENAWYFKKEIAQEFVIGGGSAFMGDYISALDSANEIFKMIFGATISTEKSASSSKKSSSSSSGSSSSSSKKPKRNN